jgi:hypothetical protein
MKQWVNTHPDLTTWAILAAGMLAVLAWSARDQGLNPVQWFWLSTATVGLAGLCAWIISWEADEPDDEEEPPSDSDLAERAPDAGT